jgi:hypothetical protein
MITSLKDREVNITWKRDQTVQTVVVKSIDLMNDWICLQNVDEDQAIFWTRMEEIDLFQVNQPKDYDPSAIEGLFNANGNLPANVTPSMSAEGGSFVKVSMDFLLPQASSDFYMASHAPASFSSIYKIMEMLDARNDQANKDGDVKTSTAISEIIESAHEILEDFNIDFDDDETQEGQ